MPETLNLNYYYGNEADQYSFYRIPKILLTDRRYKGVSLEAKVLYGLLLDRMGLSARNGWLDDNGRVFLYFTQEEAMAMLDCGKDNATKPQSSIPIPSAVSPTAYVRDLDTPPLLQSLPSSTRRGFSIFFLPLPSFPCRILSCGTLEQILYGICNSILCVLNYFWHPFVCPPFGVFLAVA